MVRTASTMLPLGTECPDFELDVVSGLELLPDDPLQGLKRIKRGDLIKRPSLVAFFSSILRRDGDDYFLITPAEKWRISVAIAPFFIISAELVNYREKSAVRMTTRTGETFFVGENNPLWLKKISSEVNPIPLVTVRGNMAGIISRPVYYDLISWARTAPDNTLIVESLGQAYSIGSF